MGEHHNLFDVGLAEFANQPIVATLDWKDSDLHQLIRIRYVSDAGFPMWDLSYAWGVNKLLQKVSVVGLPTQLNKRSAKHQKITIYSQLVEAAKQDGVYLQGLCAGNLRDIVSTLI